jgi:LEA14-like dessication related protein
MSIAMTTAARPRALSRREPRRHLPALAILVLALAGLSSAGCVTFRRPEVAFHGVEVRSFGSAGAELAATFEVTNHNSYAIQLDHFTYRVTINGGEAGGASVDGVTTLPGHETTLVHMGLSLDWGKLKDMGLQFFTHGVDYAVEGEITFTTPVGRFTRPYHHAGRYALFERH